MAKTRGAIIRDDPASRALTIFGYVFFLLTVIFAVDFQDYDFAIASLAVLCMQLIGERLNQFAGAPVARVAKPKLNSALAYVAIDLALFAALDIIAANPQSLPGLALSSLGPLVTKEELSNVLAIGSMFTIQVAIAEERFFRGGLANVGAKYGGPLGGIFLSAVVFFAFHVPAYYAMPLTLLIIGADGAVLAWSDFDTGRIITSMLAHLINNLLFVLTASVFGPSLFTDFGIVFPVAPLVLVLAGVAVDVPLVYFLTARQRPSLSVFRGVNAK